MTRLVALSIAAGIGTALALRFPAPLADPISCPGIFDFVAVIASRTWRDVPLGSMLAAGNSVVVFLALLLLARAVHTLTSATGLSIAITLAAALSPLFAPSLAPSAGAAFLTAVAAWAAVLHASQSNQSTAFHGGAVALLALAAASVTPFTLPAVLIAGWLMRKRTLYAVLAVTMVLFSSLVVQIAMPQGRACLIPGAPLQSLFGAGRAIVAIVAANPLVAALAALGLISIRRLSRLVILSLIALAVVSLWGTMTVPEQPASTGAAFELAFWLLAAVGLIEVWEVASHRRAARDGGQALRSKVGAFALSVVLVALQAASAISRRAGTPPSDGHEQLTLAMIGAVVGSVPRGAALVVEDATVDLLTRALPSRLRSADRFRFVSRDRAAIAEAQRTTRVFALPRSQRLLQHMGVELIDASGGGAAGLAEVRQVHACSTLDSSPAPLPSLTGQRQLALVAGGEQSRDSIVIMLTADEPLSVLPMGWPPNALRGLHARTFDRTIATDERDFIEELRTYALFPWPGPDTRYAARIEAWRTPGAPLVLPLSLGGMAGTGTARRLGSSPNQDLRLCPSFPYEVRPVAGT